MAVKVLILEDNPVARSFLCRVVRESFSDTIPVSYTHLRAHETVLDLVCRLLLENNK